MAKGRLKKSEPIKTAHAAPCGMNCRLCRAYIRDRNTCHGCFDEEFESIARSQCKIRNCDLVRSGKVRYCFECSDYPCDNLDHLDRRYRNNYGMSMLENLQNIRKDGVRAFVRQEKKRWACPDCGEVICVHKERCISCGHKWR